MPEPTHKPPKEMADPAQLLLGFLDYYRSVIARKLEGLSDGQVRTSRLPSGWTPLELLKHLVFMEDRWLRWGFSAEQVPEPWGDHDDAGRWHVGGDETPESLIAALHAAGRRTREIVARAELGDRSAAGGRFAEGDPLPSLAWILVYVLQEYARHAGHLDVARELADGAVGE